MKKLRSVLAFALVANVLLVVGAPSPSRASDTPQSALVNPDPADWTPNILDGQVNAIVQIGNKVVVGGTFTQVRRAGTSATLTRNYLFAFDMNTGVIDPNFVPQLNAQVLSLARGPDGTSVYVGGMFSTVNGVTYRNIARLRLSDGQAISTFKANTNARVQDMELNNGWLYVSGKFTLVKSVARSGLARLDPATGNVDPNLNLPFTNPLRGTLGVPEIDVSPDGTKLVAIGSFSRVAGQERVQVAMLNVGTTPATLSSWQTSDYPVYDSSGTTTWCSSAFETYLRSVKISPDNSYFVIVTTGAYRAGRLCDSASRWELNATGPNQHPTWTDWSGGDTSWSVSITGTAVYVGGHFRWWNNPYRGDTAGPGAVPREGIAALDPLSGLPFSWNPGHERGVGIFTLPATPDGLWAGSDTDHTGGEFHQKIAFYPLEGGFTPPPIVTYPLPGDLYTMEQSNGTLSRRSYDLATLGSSSTLSTGIDWRNARGAFSLNGRIYYGMNDGFLYSRSFDGATLGPAEALNLYGLEVQPPSTFNIPGTTTRVPAFTTDIAAMTGMFYDNGRIYYTVSKNGNPQVANNNRLYYRYFNPESGIVGANLFVAASYPTDPAIQWGNVRGMTLASGKLIYALTDGRLYQVDWNGTKPIGTPVQISSATTWQSRGMFVFNPPPPDTTAPTTPGTPVATPHGAGSVRVEWDASTDASPITYRVYRDGESTPVGETGSTSFVDTGLTPGSTHTYTVRAVDAAGNESELSATSNLVEVSAVIFTDNFTTGDFSRWTTAAGLTIDASTGSPTAPSAKADGTTQAAFATKDLPNTYASACVSTDVSVSSLAGDSIDLFRLRTATGGPIVKVFVNAVGSLVIRSDFAAAQQTSGVDIGSGWHNVELCGSVGAATTWDLYRDGVKIVDAWATDSGTDPIGRIQLGDTGIKAYSINFDHVRADTAPGGADDADTSAPTTPGRPAATGVTATTVSLSWTPAFDDSTPITYRVYRDGGASPIATTTDTTFVDTGLAPASTHTYRVDAVDPGDRASGLSPASDPITLATDAFFQDDFSTGNFTNWTQMTRLTIDANNGAQAPSAVGSPSAQSAFAFRDLPSAYASACFSVDVNVASQGGTTLDLFRLRSATAGPIAKVFVSASGILIVRSDFAAIQQSSNVALGTGWHNVELCGTVGAAGSWSLYRDGVRIVNGWTADTGSDPIGRVQIGDTAAKTWTARFDNARLDQGVG